LHELAAARRNQGNDRLFLNRSDLAITRYASGKRPDLSSEIQCRQNFPNLHVGVNRIWAIASGSLIVENFPVPGQNDTIICSGNPDDFVVFQVIPVYRIESQQSESSGQLSQMNITDESWFYKAFI